MATSAMARADLVSAGLRHVRDAENLAVDASHRSLDQAVHLIGFGPECIRKGCVDEQIADKAIGHNLLSAPDVVMEFLLAYDPEARRYDVGLGDGDLPLCKRYWRPDLRYERTGTADATLRASGVGEMLREVRRFVDGRVHALWCDGAIDEGALE